MRVPLSWLRSHVDLPDVSTYELAERLTSASLKVERIERSGADVDGVVVARVVAVEELAGFKKPIRWVTLDDGSSERQVICGATNFAVDDVIAYARPPATLPGGFTITRRRAYERDSDGMICSARELGIGEDHTGILVLPRELPLGADVVDALGLRDEVLDIEVTTDRGYALSIRGVAREAAIAYGVDFDDPGLRPVPDYVAPGWDVTIDDASGCDRYVARLVTGVDPSATSPAWLQRRLTLAGMRPISLAVDVTNHVMLDLGQPLHAFDRGRLRGGIVVRRAQPGERIRTLDDVDRALHPADLVIADESGPVAIAGVMGGASTEIGDASTDIVLESAHFDAVSVAYTARRHRLPSEASRRFERGVDPALAPVAAQAACAMLTEFAAAAAAPAGTDVNLTSPREVIRLDPALPSRLTGVDYDDSAVVRRLREVGCDVQEATGAGELTVTPPTWRPDLSRPEDLVEEVARLEGYDRLPVTVPAAPAGRGLSRRQRQRRVAARALADSGYVEVLTYPFVREEVASALLLEPGDGRIPTVRVANPMSDEEPFLRPTLLPGLLAALGRNVGRGFADLALYETGLVFRRRDGQGQPQRPKVGVRPSAEELAALEATLPYQPLHLAVVLAGARERSGWWGEGRPATWADAIEAARTVAASLGVSLDVRSDVHAPWHPGRCAALDIDGRLVGHAGELHPRVIEAFELPARTCAMELRLDDLLDAARGEPKAPPISAFPPATFDLAFVVEASVPAASVAAAVRAGAGPLLEDLRLFDVFEGVQVGEGRKSLAFTLRLRAPDRTLTAEETATVRAAAVRAAAEQCGATLRGS